MLTYLWKGYSMKYKTNLKIMLYLFLTIIVSYILILILYYSKQWPNGNDVWGHIFKAQVLYDEIVQGNYSPVATQYWYNGIDLFRYWPPLSYYMIAFLAFITNGNIINASFLFIILCMFLSNFGFLLFGYREKKPTLSFILGTIYFFLPHNIEVLFFEGNYPRAFINALLPIYFFFLYEIIKYAKKYACFLFILTLLAITYTHIMISAMVGISTFLLIIFICLP